jgi:hypothetical protein
MFIVPAQRTLIRLPRPPLPAEAATTNVLSEPFVCKPLHPPRRYEGFFRTCVSFLYLPYTTPKSPHLACVVSRKIQRATARRTPKLQGTQPLCHIRMFPRRSLVSLTRSILSHNSIDHAAVGGLSPSRFSNRDAVHSLPHSPHPLSADLCMGNDAKVHLNTTSERFLC